MKAIGLDLMEYQSGIYLILFSKNNFIYLPLKALDGKHELE